MRRFLRTVSAIVRKDLRVEFRSRELINAMTIFALLSILIFSFALELNRNARIEVISGVFWVTLVFASILGLNRSLATEIDQGSLSAMLIAPIDRVAIYIGKMLGNFLFTMTVGLILLPLMSVIYNINLLEPLILVALALGTLGFASVGTLLATMTAQTRARETLLPIAMMPIALPILMIVVRATRGVVEGDVATSWYITLLVVDLLYLAIGTLLFEYVVEE